MSDHEDHITNELKAIRCELNKALFGNGRAGLYEMRDDLYGPANQSRKGVMHRVETLEASVLTLAEQRKETKWLQRGIAIGVGLVTFDAMFGVNLAGLAGRLFGIG